MFKHFLITRFNLRNPSWTHDKKNMAVLTDTWLENRFHLFKDYCFPSVCAQTNQNFEWLVFFDITTPVKYKNQITALENKMPNFKSLYVEGMANFLPTIKSYLSSFDAEFIITSRIDNDDAISNRYIEEVQKQFKKQDFMALDFIDGYTLQIQPDVRLGKRLDQFNPFISLIEKNLAPVSVWNMMRHSHWKRVKNITQIRNKRIWTAIIHQENKVNRFDGYGNIDVTKFFKEFNISENKKDFIKTNLIPQRQWKFLSFKNAYKSYSNLYYKKLKRMLGIYRLK